MNVLTVLLLFTAFLITRVSNLRLAIQILIVQSLGVAVACVWIAGPTPAHPPQPEAELTP